MTLAEAVRLASSRDSWKEVDVAGVLAGLKSLQGNRLRQVLTEAGLAVYPSDTKAELIVRVRLCLTAIPRALERAEV